MHKFDVQTFSEANRREHWARRANRVKAQKLATAALWRLYKLAVAPPCTILLTRHSSRLLDTDNLAGAFKAVRDAIAQCIGIDDGSDLVRYEYAQVRESKRVNYFTVTIKN